MIDIATYKQMHPNALKSENRDELGKELMSHDEPPMGESFGDKFLLCLPSTIPGYNMQKKEWGILNFPAKTRHVLTHNLSQVASGPHQGCHMEHESIRITCCR